jgi:hypothetical protein
MFFLGGPHLWTSIRTQSDFNNFNATQTRIRIRYISFNSEYNSRFKPAPKGSLTQPIQHKANYVANPDKLDCTTTNKTDFVSHFVTPINQRKPEKYKPGLYFEGNSSYKTDFGVHEMKPRYVHPSAIYVPSKDKMDGKSTNQEDFKAYEVKKIKGRHDNQFAAKKEPLW